MQKQQGLLNKSNPKIQEQVDVFVANGIQIIHNQRVSNSIINNLKNVDDPVDAIAAMTLKVVGLIEADAEKKGAKLADVTKISGASQLMGEIIHLGEASGAIQPLSDEQKYQAFSLAVSTYLDNAVSSGKMSKEQLMAYAREAQQTPEGQKIASELQKGQASQGSANVPPAQVSAGQGGQLPVNPNQQGPQMFRR